MNEAELVTAAASKAIEKGIEVVAEPLLKPPAEAAGHALTTLINVFNMVLAPLERAQIRSQDKTDRLRAELAKGYEEIPEENRVEPPLEIVGPTLESLKYVEDEKLQNMFVELLISSMDSEKQEATHRAFVKIIDRLSPFDAKILEMIAVGDILFARINLDESSQLRSIIPFAFLKNRKSKLPLDDRALEFHLVERSLDNLLGLKLISVNELNPGVFQHIIVDCVANYNMEPESLGTFPKDYVNILSYLQNEYKLTFPFDLNITGYILSNELEEHVAEISLSTFGSDFCKSCIDQYRKIIS